MSAPAQRRRPMPRFHRVTVIGVDLLTPGMRRITFTGDDLADYPNDGPGTHCKLLLPAAGQRTVPLPEPGEGGGWPEGQPRPIMRTYTPRLVDTAERRLVVDFALHGDTGPASSWALTAAPGDEAVVTGGRGAYRLNADAAWTLIVADETALPAVSTILEAATPTDRVLLVAEVAAEADQLKFDTAADLTVTWLDRSSSDQPAGALAAQAVQRAELPEGSGSAWIGLEASAMRVVRRHLLGERGLDRAALHSRGYWKLGASNHPDHDTGEDE